MAIKTRKMKTDWKKYLKENPHITYKSVLSAQIMEQAEEDGEVSTLDWDKINELAKRNKNQK